MELFEIAQVVASRRTARRWSVEEAARRADINRVTWARVEAGLPVRDVKLRAVLDVLDIDPNPIGRRCAG